MCIRDSLNPEPCTLNPEPITSPAVAESARTPKERQKEGEAERSRWFESEFWPIVWAKKDVGHARKAWLTKVLDRSTADLAIAAAKQQGAGLISEALIGGRGVLHPATWITGERWKDEQPLALTAVNGGGAHPAKLQTFSERNEEIRNRKFMERMAQDLTNG